MIQDFQYNLVKSEDDIHYLEYKDSYYKINIYTTELLQLIKEGYSRKEIAYKMNVDESEIEIILDKIVKIITRGKNDKIKSICVLVNSKLGNYIGSLLSFMFENRRMKIICLVAALINIIFYLVHAPYSLLFPNITIVLYLTFLLMIMFFHEIGHVCAAYSYSLRNLKVKLGLFFIWPIFYVDMNRQILLQPRKRIKISLGGIYFQLVFSMFIILFFWYTHYSLLLLLLNMNNIVILVNLLPVLVLDGYWVYSDIIGIDNLNKKSNDLIINSFKNIRCIKRVPLKLSIYAITRLLVICFIVYYVIKLLCYRLQFTLDMWYLLHEEISFGLILRVLWWGCPFILLLTYIIKKLYGRYSKNC